MDRKTAHVGDRLVVPAGRVGDRERQGEILEILGEPGREHFRVRWEDEHESVFYPGSDTVLRGPAEEAG